MRHRIIFVLALLCAMATNMSCAILDGDTAGTSPSPDALSIMQQPVFLEPVFVLEGIEELPDGMILEELHVGVGAIFLEVVADDTGIAYANRTPFQLHFDVVSGTNIAEAPRLTLPHGGDFQVSVQLEPQILVGPAAPQTIASLEGDPEEASLLVSGALYETDYTNEDDEGGTIDEPVPLPWYPDDDVEEAVSGLRRTVRRIPFTYSSARTVRFIVDEVHLEGGSSNQLVMRLQVATWVEETIKPALYSALSDIADDGIDSTVEDENIDLSDRLESAGGGMDGLIGGMDVEVK